MGRGPGMPLQHGMEAQFSTQTTSLIAKELLEKGSSPTAEAILRSGAKPLPAQASIRPKQQLLYLADVLGFQVQFTDFPKVSILKKIQNCILSSFSASSQTSLKEVHRDVEFGMAFIVIFFLPVHQLP